MKLIPQSIKNLFNRLFKRAPKAEPVVAAVAPAPAVVEVKAPEKPAWLKKRAKTLDQFKSDKGVYTFELDISRPAPTAGQMTMMITSHDAELYMTFTGNASLAVAKTLGNTIENHLKKNFDIGAKKIYFKMKDENFYVDALDAFTGLPSGNTYQIVVVPENVKWKPPVYVPPPRKALAESCPIISPPPLPQYLHQKLFGAQQPKPNPFMPKR